MGRITLPLCCFLLETLSLELLCAGLCCDLAPATGSLLLGCGHLGEERYSHDKVAPYGS